MLRKHQVLSAHLLGVLLTKYESQTLISRETLSGLQSDGLPLFDTIIPKRTAAERMVSDLVVLGDDEADPDLAQAYAKFTMEVMTLVDSGPAESRKAPCLRKTPPRRYSGCSQQRAPRPGRRPPRRSHPSLP